MHSKMGEEERDAQLDLMQKKRSRRSANAILCGVLARFAQTMIHELNEYLLLFLSLLLLPLLLLLHNYTTSTPRVFIAVRTSIHTYEQTYPKQSIFTRENPDLPDPSHRQP